VTGNGSLDKEASSHGLPSGAIAIDEDPDVKVFVVERDLLLLNQH
jgi:hypothetical protein